MELSKHACVATDAYVVGLTMSRSVNRPNIFFASIVLIDKLLGNIQQVQAIGFFLVDMKKHQML